MNIEKWKKVLGNKVGITIYSWTMWLLYLRKERGLFRTRSRQKNPRSVSCGKFSMSKADYLLECPRLWRIKKNSLHNESIYKWVNSAPLFLDSNYFELLTVLSSLQKSAFLKLTILFFTYFWCQIEWKKHPFFSTIWFKNKRVWEEKIRNKPKMQLP